MRCSVSLLTILVLTRFALAETPPPSADAISNIEKFVAHEVESKHLPAVSIALIHGNSVLWSKGFGFADAGKKNPATADTIYRVGGVSHLFTTVAILKLVEERKLDLDLPVTTYLPNLQPKNRFDRPITLRHLITHHSGLVSEPPIGNSLDPHPASLEKTVLSLNATELMSTLGEKYRDANADGAVLGYVIEKMTGQPFASWMATNLFEKVGMKQSGFMKLAANRPDAAQGLMWTLWGRDFPAPEFDAGVAPALGMRSSVNDLALFLRTLVAGSAAMPPIVNKETRDQMWNRQFVHPENKGSSGVGLGFSVNDDVGSRRVFQSGTTLGFETEIMYLPDEKLGVVVASSCDSTRSLVREIARFSLDSLLAAKNKTPLPSFERALPLPPGIAKKWAGHWKSTDGSRRFELHEREGRLWLWLVNVGSWLEVKQLGNDFVIDDRLAESIKIGVGDGSLTFLNLKFLRTAVTKPKPVAPAWAGLIGEYGPDFDILQILERDGRLYALMDWTSFYVLDEKSENLFVIEGESYRRRGGTIQFTRDATGRATSMVVDGITYLRRKISGDDGGTFQIKPIRQMDGLRKEALAARPPNEVGDFRKPDLVALTSLESDIHLDIRYASDNNFLGTPFYTSAQAFMQKPAAEAVARAHRKLAAQGFGLLIHDAYRPWYVTKMFWDATPEAFHQFVADPSKGSRHNRGCAVDLTLYDLKTGKPMEMTGGYDEFSDRSYPDYPGGTSLQRWHRELLRSTMEAEGFSVYEAEWWHFDFKDWRQYPIMTRTFEELGK